jgi:integrase/recombinase XerD
MLHGLRLPQVSGKTPVLQANGARTLIHSIDVSSLPGLRDRALTGLMVYTFTRVGAAIAQERGLDHQTTESR